MTEEEKFFQWVGYLANPVRRTEIHVELPRKKEERFRAEYQELTGEILSLEGDNKAPFNVYPDGPNKWGIERRVIFQGEEGTWPQALQNTKVTTGRVKASWRINNKQLVTDLFKMGFRIGYNTDRSQEIQARVPKEFMPSFYSGLKLMSESEHAESLIRQTCEETCSRTLPIAEIREIWSKVSASGTDALDESLRLLHKRKIISTNDQEKVLTFSPPNKCLDKEIQEIKIRQAIATETHPDKQEYLIETYARNHGWKNLAKKIFGTHCMYKECDNTFIKEDKKPYIEVHHIVPLHENGEDGIWNLSVLCAHHHRMAHFANNVEKEEMKNYLLKKNNDTLKTLRS